MRHSSVIVEDVKNLHANGKQLLEDMLGEQLRDDQQVFIMVLSPGNAPDDEARHRARAALTQVFATTEAHARLHGIADAEVDAAIQEAMDHIRPATE